MWSRRCHKMVPWSVPLHGIDSDLGYPGCGDWFRGMLMTQVKSVRGLQGLVYWSCFLSESWCQGNVKPGLPAVIFLDQRVTINLSTSEWSWEKEGERALTRLLISSGRSHACPDSSKRFPVTMCHDMPPSFFKASLSWFLSHETQRRMTSMIPKLNNSFRAIKGKRI